MHYCIFLLSFAASLDPDLLHPRLQNFAALQITRDERYEDFKTDPNTMNEEFPGYTVELGTPLAVGKYTLVYGLIGGPMNLVIKYKNDCEGDSLDLHPLLRDAWFSWIANKRYPMTPRIHFVSPAIPLPDRPTRKLGFRMSRDSWTRCRSRNGSVRFMVMDRVLGLSITEYKQTFGPGGMSVLESVAIAGHLLKYLEVLHSNGIVHGNLNSDNVMISGPHDGTEGLHLIDFSKAFFHDHVADEENIAVPPFGPVTDPLASPWELRGFTRGMRDDIYRALDVLARMINNRGWEVNFDIIVRMGRSGLLSWRLNGSIFEVNGMSPFRAQFLGVSETTVQEIRNRFSHIMEIVLNLNDINAIPPYTEIQQLLSEIHDLLSGQRVVRDDERVRPSS